MAIAADREGQAGSAIAADREEQVGVGRSRTAGGAGGGGRDNAFQGVGDGAASQRDFDRGKRRSSRWRTAAVATAPAQRKGQAKRRYRRGSGPKCRSGGGARPARPAAAHAGGGGRGGGGRRSGIEIRTGTSTLDARRRRPLCRCLLRLRSASLDGQPLRAGRDARFSVAAMDTFGDAGQTSDEDAGAKSLLGADFRTYIPPSVPRRRCRFFDAVAQ